MALSLRSSIAKRCSHLNAALYSFMNFGVYIQLSLANGSRIVRLSQGVASIMLSKRLYAMSAPFVRFSLHKSDLCRW
ncbi:hypothetical protein CGK10_23735 [Vibrio parahaemolyticus]|nr:hypothetical protein CGK10_23735 [Vibrio parahaemolyticus]